MSESDDPVDAQARSRIGTMLCGKYRIEAVLGVEGMATVYSIIVPRIPHVKTWLRTQEDE